MVDRPFHNCLSTTIQDSKSLEIGSSGGGKFQETETEFWHSRLLPCLAGTLLPHTLEEERQPGTAEGRKTQWSEALSSDPSVATVSPEQGLSCLSGYCPSPSSSEEVSWIISKAPQPTFSVSLSDPCETGNFVLSLVTNQGCP